MKSFEELVSTSDDSDYCVFGYDTPNLGDYVQTLAILQHVKPRKFVLRDRIEPDRELILVANGWMSHGPFPGRSDFKEIKYVGIHLDPSLRTREVAEGLGCCGTIGCRDTSTASFLRHRGIAASLCRCPTLTFPQYDGPREGIVCVTLNPKIGDRVARKFSKHGDVIALSHDVERLLPDCLSDGSFTAMLRRAYDHLLIYRKAKLVVTGKVHVALPCIAFGTPLIYCGPRDERFGVFEGVELGEGWQRFRRHRMLPWSDDSIPTPHPNEQLKADYLDFLRTVLSDDVARGLGGRGLRPLASGAHR